MENNGYTEYDLTHCVSEHDRGKVGLHAVHVWLYPLQTPDFHVHVYRSQIALCSIPT